MLQFLLKIGLYPSAPKYADVKRKYYSGQGCGPWPDFSAFTVIGGDSPVLLDYPWVRYASSNTSKCEWHLPSIDVAKLHDDPLRWPEPISNMLIAPTQMGPKYRRRVEDST